MLDEVIENMRVIIPVGGVAKRLLPLTAEVSKACLRLLNRPLIEIPMLCLARQGVKYFIFGVKGYTNYRSLYDPFESGIGFSARYSITPRIHIKYQVNEEDVGSADSARINMEYYNVNDTVLAVQGDNIFDIDLRDFLSFHREKEAAMTIGLRSVKDVTGYGTADIDSKMRIRGFIEKPQESKASSHLVNTGLYVLSPEIRSILREEKVKEMISRKKRLDFGYDLIPYLIATGRPVYGYVLKGSWYDVGTPERYLEAMRDILHGQLRCLKDFGGRISENVPIWIQGESPSSIERRKRTIAKIKKGLIELEGSVLIGRHCEISDGANIRDSCIDNYTRIGKNVTIENSAVMDRSVIGDGATIRESIIGRHSIINSALNNPTTIDAVSVIADDVTVEPGSHLESVKVYPHLHVQKKDYNQTVLQE